MRSEEEGWCSTYDFTWITQERFAYCSLEIIRETLKGNIEKPLYYNTWITPGHMITVFSSET